MLPSAKETLEMRKGPVSVHHVPTFVFRNHANCGRPSLKVLFKSFPPKIECEMNDFII